MSNHYIIRFVRKNMRVLSILQNVRLLACLLSIMACFQLTGCSVKADPTEKIKDLEFTVLSEENIPKELQKVIDERKEKAFHVTYTDNGFLYICSGYGEQVSGGYSIIVNALYLTENAIYVDTTLQGPDPSEPISAKKSAPSYPVIVIKTEQVDKSVVFN